MKVKVLFGFLLSFLMLNGIKSACNYFQKYKGAQQCTWQMTSCYVTKINCSIDIPAFADGCTQDSLSIQFSGRNITKYCGSGTLILEGTNPIIKLYSPSSSQGGQFLCQIQEYPFENKNNCKCGWKKVTRIVGGKETGVNEFPMMGGLVDSTMRMIYCGCTIISKQDVLTAAHCIEGRNVSNMGVVVGEHDVTTGKDTNATKMFRVSNCTIHPDYNNETNQNDIAVCKINGTLKYSAEVGPVCLPFHRKQDSFVNKNVTMLGWGTTAFGGATSSTLQKVEVEIEHLKKCKIYYPNLTDKNICTYSPGKDSCQMDSGGPVLWHNPCTGNLLLVGIISEGIGCGEEPSLAMRTGAFIDWIVSVTPGVQYCMVE